MAKFLLINVTILLLCYILAVEGGQSCPAISKISAKNQKCTSDNECKNGGKCCPNDSNGKSCVEPGSGDRYGSSDKYGSNKYGADKYGGVKCGKYTCQSYQTCDQRSNQCY